MRKFGEKEEFSIVTGLDENYFGVWLNGFLFYEIKNEIIGDRDEGVSLRDAYYILESIVERKNFRENKHIFSMDYNEIFHIINGAIYNDDEELFKYIDEKSFAGDFSIRVNVQSMLDYKIYSVSFDGKTKIVYQNMNDMKIFGLIFYDDIVETTLMEVFEYLKKLHDREVAMEKKE